MTRLVSATLFAAAAAAKIYRKRLLRSVPICDSSHRYLSAAAGFGKTYERKRLPAELSALENVAELTCESAARGGICHVYLIGTAHSTQKSCEEVKTMIKFVKPEAVFLELCPHRAYFLPHENPGLVGEFRVAYDEGIKHGAKNVILGDRAINVTLDRFPIMMHCWDILVSPLRVLIRHTKERVFSQMDGLMDKFSNLPFDEIKRIVDDEIKWTADSEDDMRRIFFPSYNETVINERDQYMSAKLQEVASRYNSVVAVVGKAHLRGIQKHWEQPVDMKQLLHAPTRTRMVTCIRRILVNRLLRNSTALATFSRM